MYTVDKTKVIRTVSQFSFFVALQKARQEERQKLRDKFLNDD